MNISKAKFTIISTVYIFIILLLIILLFKIITLKNLSKEQEEKYNALNTKYIISQNQLDLKKKQFLKLNSEFLDLNNNYNKLNSNYISLKNLKTEMQNDINSLESNYSLLEEEYDYLINDINKFRVEIQESMDWFKDNSAISNLEESKNRKVENTLNECIVCEKDFCKIKTACIYLKNEKTLKLKYSEDKLITNELDKLQSLDSFLENRKGDCEDYALLYAAELRYLFERAEAKNKEVFIESIIETDTKRSYYINSQYYFPEGIEGYKHVQNFKFPYVACGTTYDLQTDDFGGHCLVLVNDKKINNVDDIKEINGIIIEPQNGLFLGIINADEDKMKVANFSLIDVNPNSDNTIYEIITENDLYFNNYIYENISLDDSQWLSYDFFLEKIDAIK
ncbi:MAG: hypothetical protein PHW45_00055 [Candidatus ainarchaeum sp.]|nr:hypothetical protein [Candidatus ainarchaeum sp.]MDD3084523.1 hypothetical protein [Candidatus ainarchaeum sp.]MDD4220804.1 hypothetical protein [Candidatus ainarchaeum sp.]MDD4662303.1 hypothetical protein [Candidatus ainarchaeum sp.]